MMEVSQIKFRHPVKKEEFDRTGFISLGKVSEDMLSRIELLYREQPVHLDNSGFYSTMMVNDIAHRSKVSSELGRIMSDYLRHFLSSYRVLFTNFLVKTPHSESYIGIHQDWNFTDETAFESLNFWMPLIDISMENGNFYAIEASHKHFVHPRGTPYINYFENYESALERVSTPLYPHRGEVILYHGRTLHFSKPNLSDKTRIAIGGVILPEEAPSKHFRHEGKGSEMSWSAYAVDSSFFHQFDINAKIEGYPFESVVLPCDYFTKEKREKIITEFLSR